MIRTAIVFAFLSMTLVGTPATAASFNCSQATTFQERTICSNPALSQLDEALSTAYKEALNSSSAPDNIKARQRAWLAERDQCGDTTCLRSSIETRIDSLQTQTAAHELPQVYAPVNSDTAIVNSDSQNSYSEAQDVTSQPSTQYSDPTQNYDYSDSNSYTNKEPPAANNTNSIPHDIAHTASTGQEKSYLAFKIALVILGSISAITIYLHHQGTLTIYNDFTDATFTSLVPLISFLFGYLLAWLEVPKPYPLIGGLIVGGIMLLVVLRSTIAANGLNIGLLMALTTKIVMITVFYVIMALFFFSGTSRREGESQSAYEARRRREARQNSAAMAAVFAMFTALSAWVCRNRQFSKFADYIAGRTH